MSDIPLHLQRRFEQRWAARFARPVVSATPKCIGLNNKVNSLARPEKAKKLTEFEPARLVSARSRTMPWAKPIKDGDPENLWNLMSSQNVSYGSIAFF